MVPSNAGITPVPYQSPFIPPDERRPVSLPGSFPQYPLSRCLNGPPADWELGGIAIGDATQGSQVLIWKFRVVGDDLQVGPDPLGPFTTLITAPGTSEIAGAFDVNMGPALAYIQNGICKLWWFDSTVLAYVITDFPDCWSPRLTLDDKRVSQQANADILFFYLRAGSLYYRQQRERYATERLLCAEPPNTVKLGSVGMTLGNRVQIDFLTG